MPKATVIIPCYNVENYLDKCLSSVINQSMKDFEIILIDDGSTDSTLEKCLEWKNKDNRIILVSKRNLGLGETRNLGISMANSEYITFLDADDWWDKTYLSEMLAGTEHGKNDLVICNFNIVYEKKECVDYNISAVRLCRGRIDKQREKYLLSRARTQAWGKLYKRNLFIENNVKEPPHNYEDVATTPYIVAKAKNIYHVDLPLYFYLKNREGSIINHFPYLEDLLLSLTELRDKFKRDGLFEKCQDEIRRIFWGELCFLYRMLDTKFSEIEEKKKVELCKKCDEIVYESFPELKVIANQKFYTENDLIKKAMGCILPKVELIIDILNNVDCVVICTETLIKKGFNGKIILLDDFNQQTEDQERLIWDLADEIFDKLTDKIHEWM